MWTSWPQFNVLVPQVACTYLLAFMSWVLCILTLCLTAECCLHAVQLEPWASWHTSGMRSDTQQSAQVKRTNHEPQKNTKGGATATGLQSVGSPSGLVRMITSPTPGTQDSNKTSSLPPSMTLYRSGLR